MNRQRRQGVGAEHGAAGRTAPALAIPMILLYLLGVGVAYLFGKRYD